MSLNPHDADAERKTGWQGAGQSGPQLRPNSAVGGFFARAPQASMLD
ncbi:hypothetical protein [Tenebrionicola larvae]|uniref:Uncharacterized protein n=1 Tax=Tenebrionicola larvae TaxID=2815733 RepID=A0A949V408_9ENTR|nr:hypothetical protein [Tenebrionicola larvae]MBV5095929.1 hypothetical protein [Tenebrionicola larvae]